MREERRLLSVLFADVVGSTELGSHTDPEVLRQELTRYFERMKEIAEAHGGTVEKFIGDAVMVVFGFPQMHDDDAERAVRCGLQMQAGMTDLNREVGRELALRVGVNTGEAVVRSGDDGQFIVGDPINVAARLQQGANPGEVVVGRLTAQLTRPAVKYLDREPTVAKGKAIPIESFQATAVTTDVPRRISRAPGVRASLVGREAELRRILDQFARVVDDRQAHLVTLVGAAGVGKSRLTDEALQHIRARSDPTILQGRCLPYGRGITYWPMMEILRTDAGITLEDDREAALCKVEKRIGSLEIASGQGPAVAARLAVLLGLTSADKTLAGVSSERVSAELAWATRHYVDGLAREKPTVLVIDDLHWAGPAMLDLVDHVSLRAANVPVFWLCAARPEFLEAHPRWGAGRANGAVVPVKPLDPVQTSALISRLLENDDVPPALRQGLVERSEGNPLFCEEFFRMLIDEQQLVRDGDHWRATKSAAQMRIPESIQALLGARLDSLPAAEKQTLQAASVVGERFSDDEVAALRPGIDVSRALDGLLQKGLALEGFGTAGSGGLRFKHLLIRDVAYGTLVKTERAELHDRFARHIEESAGDRRDEFAEIIVYHANLALTLSKEMRLPAELTRARAERARSWNMFSAERARSRNDWVGLADRVAACEIALEVLRAAKDDPDRLQLRLLQAELLASADSYDAALSAAAEVAELASGAQQWHSAASAHLFIARIGLRRDSVFGAVQREAADAARLFQMASDVAGELEAEWLGTLATDLATNQLRCVDRCRQIAERAAQLDDDPRAASWMSMTANLAVAVGHPEARQITATVQQLIERARLRPPATLIGALAGLDALSGDLSGAVSRLEDAIAANMDEAWDVIYLQRYMATFLMNAGRLAELDLVLDDAIKRSQESGEQWNRTELLARRSLSAIRQRALHLAEHYVIQAMDSVKPDDVSGIGEAQWALAELRAAQGRDAEAETHYGIGLSPVQRSIPYSSLRVEIELSLARFLISRGRGREAVPLLDASEAWMRSLGYSYLFDEIADLRKEVAQSEAR